MAGDATLVDILLLLMISLFDPFLYLCFYAVHVLNDLIDAGLEIG